jgi:integrase
MVSAEEKLSMPAMNKTRIRTLKEEAKRIAALTAPGMHKVNDGPGLHGLYLQIAGPKARSWIYRYMRGGKQRDFGLGSAFLLSLEDAAVKADSARLIHAEGGDPIEQRKAAKLASRLERARGITFKKVAEEYIAQHSPAWKSAKHREQWGATLRDYVYPSISDTPIQAIDVAMVLHIIRPIWLEKTETASRVRGRIEMIIDYATPQYRVGDNPASWKILKSKLPKREKIAKVEHHAALPYGDIAAFMADLRGRASTSARCLEFTILTAARSSEVRGATWPEIDLYGATWTIPAERMKADNSHRVPLSGRAVEILRDMQKRRENDLVFPGAKAGRPLSDASLSKMLVIMGRDDVTVHGFRSTFRDWAAERTNFPRELAEKALAHTVGDETERAYQRGDLFEKRRRLMDAWAAALCGKTTRVGQVGQMRVSAKAV